MQRLLGKLRVKRYRHGYVSAQVRNWVAYQIRALRKERGWSQVDLATKTGKPQSVISRMEDPNYGRLNLQTLLDVASTFDVALSVQFVSFGEFLKRTADVSSAAMEVRSYDRAALSRELTATTETDWVEFTVSVPALRNRSFPRTPDFVEFSNFFKESLVPGPSTGGENVIAIHAQNTSAAQWRR